MLANGEKVPPVDMELAIQLDPLLEQVLVVGEGKPYLGALVVLDMEEWFRIAGRPRASSTDPAGEKREKAEKFVARAHRRAVHAFPGYAQVRKVALLTEQAGRSTTVCSRRPSSPSATSSSSATRTGWPTSTRAHGALEALCPRRIGVEFKRPFEIPHSHDRPLPNDEQPVLRIIPMPADTNAHGTIFGGWVMAQVDLAGSVPAVERAAGPVVTVAVNSFLFKEPVFVGDLVSFYARVVEGRPHVHHRGRRGLRAARARRTQRGREGHRSPAHLRRHRCRPPPPPGARRRPERA